MEELDPQPQRVVSGEETGEDETFELQLRPQRFEEFTGQRKVKERLGIFVQAARERGDALDHVLLHGPPGLGKTTLAHIIANELGVDLRTSSGPAIERPGDLAAILTNLAPKDVLFVDEIHRLQRTVEEILYPAMEDYALDIVIGKGPSARTLRLDLPPFTLIGATTRSGLLTSPLRDRFGVVSRLDYYGVADIREILVRAAGILEVEVDHRGAEIIARRSRGTPRVAHRLLRRLRDFAQVRADGVVTARVAKEGLKILEVDELGLDKIDQRVITVIIEKFDGGPVGLGTLAAAISEETQTIEDVYEPYLMQIGFLKRTPRGREATRLAYEHFGYPRPERAERGSGEEDGGVDGGGASSGENSSHGDSREGPSQRKIF